MTYEIIIPAIVRAARRAPTPAGLASLRAALTGATDPSNHAPRPGLHGDPPDSSLALPAPAPRPDPHDLGQPDPAFDWMFRPKGVNQ